MSIFCSGRFQLLTFPLSLSMSHGFILRHPPVPDRNENKSSLDTAHSPEVSLIQGRAARRCETWFRWAECPAPRPDFPAGNSPSTFLTAWPEENAACRRAQKFSPLESSLSECPRSWLI